MRKNEKFSLSLNRMNFPFRAMKHSVSHSCQTRVNRRKNLKILEFMNSRKHKACHTLFFPSVRTTCHFTGTDHTPCLGRLFTTITELFVGVTTPPPPSESVGQG